MPNEKNEDHSETALLSRSIDFVASARTLITHREHGYISSSTLLMGFAAELIAKKRMLSRGSSEDDLKEAGHEIKKMWEKDAALLEEARDLAREFQLSLTFDIHLDYLDFYTSRRSGYSSRYNSYKGLLPNPVQILPIFEEIVLRERMR